MKADNLFYYRTGSHRSSCRRSRIAQKVIQAFWLVCLVLVARPSQAIEISKSDTDALNCGALISSLIYPDLIVTSEGGNSIYRAWKNALTEDFIPKGADTYLSRWINRTDYFFPGSTLQLKFDPSPTLTSAHLENILPTLDSAIEHFIKVKLPRWLDPQLQIAIMKYLGSFKESDSIVIYPSGVFRRGATEPGPILNDLIGELKAFTSSGSETKAFSVVLRRNSIVFTRGRFMAEFFYRNDGPKFVELNSIRWSISEWSGSGAEYTFEIELELAKSFSSYRHVAQVLAHLTYSRSNQVSDESSGLGGHWQIFDAPIVKMPLYGLDLSGMEMPQTVDELQSVGTPLVLQVSPTMKPIFIWWENVELRLLHTESRPDGSVKTVWSGLVNGEKFATFLGRETIVNDDGTIVLELTANTNQAAH